MPADLSAMFGLPKPREPKPLGRAPAVDLGLLEEDFAPHYTAWKKSPGSHTAGAMLEAVDPVIRSALRTYGGASQTSPTLRSRAKLIVLDSLPRYDPQQAKLRTYLMTNLQSLRRAAAEEEQIISVPERVRLAQHHLHVSTAELTDRLGREPSDAELSRHAGVPLRRLEHIRKARGSLAEGQTERPVGEAGQPGESPALAMPRGRDTYLRFIYGDLAPIDQFILEHSVGLHGKPIMPKGEIARRLSLSAGAVSQRAAKIQAIIDKHENMGIQVL